LFTPHTYPAALLLMMLSMLSLLGKLGQYSEDRPGWRFELFYLDYTFGLLAAAVLFRLTFGRIDATSAK
jgi:glucose uptake protein